MRSASPKEHIEEIRKNKFSIGAKERNPLIIDLHEAVKNLSAELYAKDVHFLMELIQVFSFLPSLFHTHILNASKFVTLTLYVYSF